MRRGFTLLELVVVVIILGILATLGFTQYTKMVEKGRTAEAKMILGQIRTAEVAYNQQYGVWTTDITAIAIDSGIAACDANHYFSYDTAVATTGRATRCSAGGKAPQGAATLYTLTLTYDTGTFGGSPGYF